MALHPRPYTDGKDRIVVRVDHKPDRERFIATLAQGYLNEHVAGEVVKPLTHERALLILRKHLAIEGHFSGDVWTEPTWLKWARLETDRLWPECSGEG